MDKHSRRHLGSNSKKYKSTATYHGRAPLGVLTPVAQPEPSPETTYPSITPPVSIQSPHPTTPTNMIATPTPISAQNFTTSLPTNPTLLDTPQCLSNGSIGVTLSGVAIFNGFDAGGRDAVATEIQDSCQGHPQQAGQYHYHGLSECLEDTSAQNQHSDLVGYIFDGFGIYGPKGEGGNEISSQDLDVCHGHTHSISWDGVNQEMFHYHMTQDFPYTVSCFRGSPVTQTSTGGESGPGGQQIGPPGARPGGPDRPPPPQ